MNIRFNTVLLAATSALPALVAVSAPANATEKAVRPALELVQRVTPEFAGKVDFRIDKKCNRHRKTTGNADFIRL